MVVNNGDESHGRIRKKSPNKQIQEIWPKIFQGIFFGGKIPWSSFENPPNVFPVVFPWADKGIILGP